MQAQRPIHRRPDTVENAIVDHRDRPADAFFGWLKHQFDRPRQLLAIFRQYLRHPQPHGHMGVMTTSVHHARRL